ncbi:MAG TPA: GNAT family N-acetyltransferase [Ktedonobacterales bacterium]
MSLEQVTEAFNLGFQAYHLPMTQTQDGLAQMIRENDVRLENSFVLYVDEHIAGVGLVGQREARGWVAGMGVAPAWRGQGIGGRLLEHLLVRMREVGLHQAQLEVLDINMPAIALYQRLGFVTQRKLEVYHGSLRRDGQRPQAVNSRPARIRAVGPRLALREFDTFHSVAPAWQRERATIERVRNAVEGLGLWDGGRLLAYVLFTRQNTGFALLDGGASAAEAEVRRDHIALLLGALADATPDYIFRVINTPPGDALGDALALLGCPVIITQREMALRLA